MATNRQEQQRNDTGNTQAPGQAQQHSGINSNFAHASPESNVGPAGAPQTSHGNAGHAIPGGTEGRADVGQAGQSGMGAAAAGGQPGTTAGGTAQNRQSADLGGGDVSSDNSGILDRVADRDNPAGPADGR